MAKFEVLSRSVKSGRSRWFSEAAIPLRHTRTIDLSLLVKRPVHRERSPLRDILLFDHAVIGRVLVLDGREFIRNPTGRFDVVLVDSTDPDGSSTPPCTEAFYRDVCRALKSGGMMVAQAGTFLDFTDLIRTTRRRLEGLISSVQTCRWSIPSYLCGAYCSIAASKGRNLAAPGFEATMRRLPVLDPRRRFRYYAPDIHRAACTLPRVWRL